MRLNQCDSSENRDIHMMLVILENKISRHSFDIVNISAPDSLMTTCD